MNDLTDVVVRLDKWMWASRFYRTRSIAKTAIQAGKVNYNGHKCKPGKIVEIGAVVTFKQGYDMKEVVVCTLSDQRRKADMAQQLYRETDPSVRQRLTNQEARKLSAFHSPHPDTKPDKKQRRELLKIKARDS